MKEIASVNVNSGPPFKAVNLWPSSSNAMGQSLALRNRAVLGGKHGVEPLGIFEDVQVELHGFFSVRIKSQERCDALIAF
jgi:hypothetical protein